MGLREIVGHRWEIALGLALLLVFSWYTSAYRPRSQDLAALGAREHELEQERDRLASSIAAEEKALHEARPAPARVAPAAAAKLPPADRLNYFLENITQPANDLQLSYFTVTPLPPVDGPVVLELPFSIAVAGTYASLADYLYQLEYGRDFVVRDMTITRPTPDSIRADFELAALLLTDPTAARAAKPTTRDPGRPTSLELARDPFVRPPVELAKGADGKTYFLNVPPGLRLTGIMQSGDRKVAIINHQPLAIGDTVENKTIVKIDPRGVVELSDKVRSYVLEMQRTVASSSKEGSGR